MNDQPPGRELARTSPHTLAVMSDSEINRSWRLAEALARSGMFPDAKDATVAFAKMLVGHDLGMTPTQALMNIDIVEGKPRIQSVALAGFVKQMPEYDYLIDEHDATKCTISFYSEGAGELGASTFTIEEAQAARLGGWPDKAKWEKSGWGKYPKNMLFARAMSNGVKWFMPDAMGGVPVYTEADEFTVRDALTQGSGDGSGPGIDLGPKVDKVIARAQVLGHEGLSSRATAEMALGNRSPEAIKEWVAAAEAELDEMAGQGAEPPEAEVVTPTAEQLEERAGEKRAAAIKAAEGGDETLASELDAEADALMDAVKAMREGGDGE